MCGRGRVTTWQEGDLEVQATLFSSSTAGYRPPRPPHSLRMTTSRAGGQWFQTPANLRPCLFYQARATNCHLSEEEPGAERCLLEGAKPGNREESPEYWEVVRVADLTGASHRGPEEQRGLAELRGGVAEPEVQADVTEPQAPLTAALAVLPCSAAMSL